MVMALMSNSSLHPLQGRPCLDRVPTSVELHRPLADRSLPGDFYGRGSLGMVLSLPQPERLHCIGEVVTPPAALGYTDPGSLCCPLRPRKRGRPAGKRSSTALPLYGQRLSVRLCVSPGGSQESSHGVTLLPDPPSGWRDGFHPQSTRLRTRALVGDP